MNETIKKLIYPVFGALIIVFALLTPIFNILDIPDYKMVINGYDIFTSGHVSLLNGSSSTSVTISTISLYSICLILLFAAIIFAVNAIIEKDEDKQKTTIFKATLFLLVACCTYFIIGCAEVSSFEKTLKITMGEELAKEIDHSSATIFPLLMSAVLAVTYFFLPKIVEIITAPRPVVVAPVAEPAVAPATTITPASEVAPASSVEDITATLTKYKTLLDAGAITQEEYDRKKDELLNN